MSKITLSLQAHYQATKMTLRVRASVAKPGVLSLIPRTYTKGEKKKTAPKSCALTSSFAYMQVHTYTKQIKTFKTQFYKLLETQG